MGSMDIAMAYSQRVREMLAQREAEAEAEAARQQNSQGGNLIGELGGTYVGKKYGASIMNALTGNNAAASNLTAPGGVPDFVSGYSGGYPGPVTPPPITPPVGPTAPPAPFGAQTFATYGIPVAAAISTYLAGKSALDALHGKSDNSPSGKFGRGQLAFTTMGLSELARHFLGDQDKWKTEGNRLKELASSGYSIPQSLIDSMPTSGRKNLLNTSVANDFVGFTPTKDWVNNKFATSRNEGDLRPEDVVNYGAFAEKFGKNYFDVPLAQRLEASKLALDAGALDEHHGTIDFNDKLNAELQNKISSILNPATTAANAKGKQSGSKLGASLGDVLVNFKKG